jgi:hypothetical protein
VLLLLVLKVRPEISMGCTIGDLVDAPLAKPRDLMALVAECRPKAEAQQKLARTKTTFMVTNWGMVVDLRYGGWANLSVSSCKLPSDSVSLCDVRVTSQGPRHKDRELAERCDPDRFSSQDWPVRARVRTANWTHTPNENTSVYHPYSPPWRSRC